MKKIKIIMPVILIFILNLNMYASKINNKMLPLLKNQITKYISNRNYEKAEELYQEIMSNNMQDNKLEIDRINNLIRMKEYEKAITLLNNSKLINNFEKFLLKIKIWGLKNNFDKVNNLVDNYIKENKLNEKQYKEIANKLQQIGNFNKSSSLILTFRKENNNEKFKIIQARNYEYLKMTKKAVNEYLKLLIEKSDYLYFINNKLNLFIKNEQLNIEDLVKICNKYDDKNINELLAKLFVSQEKYYLALQAYKKIDRDKLLFFAGEMIKLEQFDIALETLEFYALNAEEDEKLITDIVTSSIFIRQKKYIEANDLLVKITENKQNLKWNRTLNIYPYVEAKKNLSKISLINNDIPMAIKELEDILNVRVYANIKLNTKLDILMIKFCNNQSISNELNKININKNYKNEIVKKMFLEYLTSSTQKDSISTELITFYGDHKLTTDIIFYQSFLNNENKEFVEKFWETFKFIETLQYKKLLDNLMIMKSLEKNKGITDIIADKWGIVGNYKLNNNLLDGYILLKICNNYSEIKDFLNSNPENTFAPGLRIKLKEWKMKENQNEN